MNPSREPVAANEQQLIEQANELAAFWNRLTDEQRLDAFLRASLAFAQYAEDTNEPSDEAVLGFATGFVMDAQLPSKVQRLEQFLREYGVTTSG